MEADFSGYATKNDILCTDGRTIKAGAFKHMDKLKVPLVWQHLHSDPEYILGHGILENREDGVYIHGYFNDTPKAKITKELVKHGDLNSLSIFANGLTERNKNVLHGDIREVSLVIAGANEGALIENVNIRHGDSIQELDDEVVITFGLTLEHGIQDGDSLEHADEDDENENTRIWNSMNDEQRQLTTALVSEALQHDGLDEDSDEGDEDDSDESSEDDDSTDQSSDEDDDNVDSGNSADEDDNPDQGNSDESGGDNIQHSQEGTDMSGDTLTHNIFEKDGAMTAQDTRPRLSHDQLQTILKDAQKPGWTLKESFLAHAEEYGFDQIDVLFPDAKLLSNQPELLARRMEWVSEIMGKTKHSPFTRIKSVVADITADEARAKGYVKGAMKKEEIVKLLKRKTGPTTVYKKQKLDRDDILDITDLDVVAWLKAEMRLMLDEEIARAILLGDGRTALDPDKIDDDSIRPIATDVDMYAEKVQLPSNASAHAKVEAMIRARASYRGSGNPVFFTTQGFLTDMLLMTDKIGRRLYNSVADVANAILASKIVPVEAMEGYPTLVGIYVNPIDYTIGTDKGGSVSMFDDFDIDFNQFKYLIETRLSGALTKPKSAVVVSLLEGDPATPVSPSFNGETNTITIPTTTGIDYQIDGVTVTGTEVITEDTDVTAVAKEGYYIPAGVTTTWTFVYTDLG